jgi:hypothetical protein
VPQQALFLMNSPLVVEQAKKLVTLAEFNSCQDDEGRIAFLYQRVYQRQPSAEEVKLGIEFIAQMPEPQKLAAEESVQPVSNDGRKFRQKQFAKQQQYRRGGNSSEFKKRPPLKAWEEYTHALLQANEASFVN